jgi:hypothetical protein
MTASLPPGSPEAGEDRGASADNKPGPSMKSLGFGDIQMRLGPPSI